MSSQASSKESTPTKSPGAKSPLKKGDGSASKEKEGADIQRQYSEQSDRTLKQLDELDTYFASFASRVEQIDKSIDMGDRRTLVAAKHELAQIIGDLESLQFNEVDGVSTSDLNSGHDKAAAHRKALNQEINMMTMQTVKLYEQIDATLQRIPESGDAKESAQPPLEREEIAKLLLLASRAYGIQQIDAQQYRTVKDAICRRSGTLRPIILEKDIASVMTALARIASQEQ